MILYLENKVFVLQGKGWEQKWPEQNSDSGG